MKCSFKQRVIAFAGVAFFMWLAAGISYLGMYKITEYLSYPDVVTFSFRVFLGQFLLFHVIFTGKQISVTSGKRLLKAVFIILGLTVLGMFIFSERYTASLMDKGYTECRGGPSGWMPGMAKKYAIEPSLCAQY